MPRNVRITVALPHDLFEFVDQGRQVRGETRSQFFRRAVQMLLEREHRDVEQYLEGYRRMPERPEEMGVADSLGSAMLAKEPWDSNES